MPEQAQTTTFNLPSLRFQHDLLVDPSLQYTTTCEKDVHVYARQDFSHFELYYFLRGITLLFLTHNNIHCLTVWTVATLLNGQ